MKYFFFFFIFIQISQANWQGQGEITLESRLFEDDAKTTTEDRGLSVKSTVGTDFKKDNFEFVFQGISRADAYDNDRTFLALEDLYFMYHLPWFRFKAGYVVLNWTATEAFHPADIINSRNLDSNLENLEKLGELTVSTETDIFGGILAFYLFPKFTSPIYPGAKSRLGLGLPIKKPKIVGTDGTLIEDQWTLQGGSRFSMTLGQADLSLHFLKTVDRHYPALVVNFDSFTPVSLTPHYFYMTQLGGTYTHVFESVILKFEFAKKNFERANVTIANMPEDHSQIAGGLEYITNFSWGAEANFLIEGQSFVETTEQERASLGAFQQDVLLGVRYAFNDIMGSEFFVSFISDLERSQEYLYNFDFQRRISDQWKIKLGGRYIDAPKKEVNAKGLELLDGASQVFLNLSRYF